MKHLRRWSPTILSMCCIRCNPGPLRITADGCSSFVSNLKSCAVDVTKRQFECVSNSERMAMWTSLGQGALATTDGIRAWGACISAPPISTTVATSAAAFASALPARGPGDGATQVVASVLGFISWNEMLGAPGSCLNVEVAFANALEACLFQQSCAGSSYELGKAMVTADRGLSNLMLPNGHGPPVASQPQLHHRGLVPPQLWLNYFGRVITIAAKGNIYITECLGERWYLDGSHDNSTNSSCPIAA